jgi:transposase
MAATTVLSGPERRRRWTSTEKLRIVEESLAPAASVAEVARRHDVHLNLLHSWRRQARQGMLGGARGGEMVRAGSSRFVPVAVAAHGDGTAARIDAAVIEVVLRNGRRLRLPEGVGTARVVTLADALEGGGR